MNVLDRLSATTPTGATTSDVPADPKMVAELRKHLESVKNSAREFSGGIAFHEITGDGETSARKQRQDVLENTLTHMQTKGGSGSKKAVSYLVELNTKVKEDGFSTIRPSLVEACKGNPETAEIAAYALINGNGSRGRKTINAFLVDCGVKEAPKERSADGTEGNLEVQRERLERTYGQVGSGADMSITIHNVNPAFVVDLMSKHFSSDQIAASTTGQAPKQAAAKPRKAAAGTDTRQPALAGK